MLPSMPVLFARESQDAFGNKIEPSTSYFNRNSDLKPAIKSNVCSRNEENSHLRLQSGSASQQNIEAKKEIKINLDDNPLETGLVRSYYTKVQSRFPLNSSLPTNKFKQFQEILRTFDPMSETPVELYKKMEQLFGDEHKDLLEEFLLFLKPGQAVQVGRFMDHFMLVQITGFIKLLNTTYSRKPTVLRKILRALSAGINSGSGKETQGRVLPHLRSSPRLLQMFKSLFPGDPPPDSVYDVHTDTMDQSFLTCDKGYDVWDFTGVSDNKRKTEVKEGLGSEYLYGRVFIQHGRLLKSACVTYPYSKEPYRSHARRIAPDHCLTAAESDTERSSPKKNNKSINKLPPKKIRKPFIAKPSPTKNCKDFNDNTKRDCSANAINSPKIKGKTNSKSKVMKKKSESQNSKKGVIEISDTIIKVANKTWTRDEDKTMLEILKGESDSELVFRRVEELLPHRTTSEIKERLHHVLNLLQEMAVGEIT